LHQFDPARLDTPLGEQFVQTFGERCLFCLHGRTLGPGRAF
jgi:hypothetical protein